LKFIVDPLQTRCNFIAIIEYSPHMHTELDNIVIRMKPDLICKSYDFQNANFSSYNRRNIPLKL
jgi:hypothetical protein